MKGAYFGMHEMVRNSLFEGELKREQANGGLNLEVEKVSILEK